jgi:hypothetical protein
MDINKNVPEKLVKFLKIQINHSFEVNLSKFPENKMAACKYMCVKSVKETQTIQSQSYYITIIIISFAFTYNFEIKLQLNLSSFAIIRPLLLL